MKTSLTLALGVLTLGIFGTSALAGNGKLVPPAFRCTSCGAEYLVKTKVTKNNAIEMKLERIGVSANPKVR
jgi:hypothetical protein